jgi:hypothetical protein
MARTKIVVALSAVAALLVAAAVAVGAPARTGTLDAAITSFEWEDGPRNSSGTEVGNVFAEAGEECFDEPGLPCDDTLLKVDAPGTLEVSSDGEGLGRPDMDLYLYASNAAGEPGKLLKASETPEPDEKLSYKVTTPGFYLVRNKYFSGFEVTYKGKATLKAVAAGSPAGPTPGVTDAAPEARLAAVAKTVKAKSLKGFKGTAADDKAVTRVEVGVLQVKGSKCSQLTAKGTFAKTDKCTEPSTFLAAKGTSSWSFKLKRALKKGTYSVFARATDDAAQVQQGFGGDSKRTFRVK